VRWSTERVEAFSDGVLAIAITLLVLGIRIDPSEFDRLGHALADEWPAYLAYVTSFLTIGGVWLTHHALFTRLRHVDDVLLRLNLLLLMLVAFLPFPTALLAEALQTSHSAERWAVAVYALTGAAIEGLIWAAQRYADAHPALLTEPAAPAGALQNPRRPSAARIAAGIVVLGGLVLLPKVATVGFLAVAIRAVFFAGGEGHLLPELWPRPGR
jgi:uncharacterized membrane protein